VSFFGPPPPDPVRDVDYRMPEWHAPPDNVLPATVALNLVVARTQDLVVSIPEARVFPTGVSLQVAVQRREPPDRPDAFLFGPPHPEGPRVGVLLAGGAKAVAGSPFPNAYERPQGPVLLPRSGGGGGLRLHSELWLWPLPPPGPLTVVYEWAAQGIAETRVEVDATPIVEAADRAVELWREERPLMPRPAI
jgi:hypothetical protein